MLSLQRSGGSRMPRTAQGDLQRAPKGNRANPHDRTIHARLATELLATNNSGAVYIAILKL